VKEEKGKRKIDFQATERGKKTMSNK